jgi:hypothetical protein
MNTRLSIPAKGWETNVPLPYWAPGEEDPMSVGGGGDQGDVFLVKPFIEWWERRRDRREAKRTARAERRARASETTRTKTDTPND